MTDSSECKDCQLYLSRLVKETLSPEEKEKAVRHLLRCQSCFNAYMALVEAEVREKKFYLYGRPRWGPFVLDYNTENKLVKDINRATLKAANDGIRLIILKYEKALEKVAFAIQLRVSAYLRRRNKNVKLLLSPGQYVLRAQELNEGPMPCYTILPQAGSFANFLETVEAASLPGTIIIAGWAEDEWGEVILPVNHTVFPIRFDGDKRRQFEERLRQEINRLTGTQKLEEPYIYIALLDALSVLTPESLIRRLAKTEDIARLIDKDAIYEIRNQQMGSPFFSTKGELIGRQVIESLSPEDETRYYGRIIDAVDADRKYERQVLIKMLRALSQRAHFSLSRSLIARYKGKIDQAIKKGDAVEILLWGKIFHDVHLYADAERVFEAGLSIEGNNIFLMHAFARLLAAARKYDESDRSFNQLQKLSPGNVFLWQSWAEAQLKKGAWKQADAMFNRALEIDPANVFTRVSYGNFLMQRKNFTDARWHLKRARRIAPYNAYVLNALGVMEMKLKRYEKSKEFFERVLSKDPQNVPTLHALGQMNKERGHLKKAGNLFNEVLEIYPENLHSFHALGEIALEEARLKRDDALYKTAQTYFEKVLSIDADNIESIISLTVLNRRRGRLPKAREYLDMAEKIEPESPYTLVNEGKLFLAEGNVTAAEECFWKALAIDDANVPAIVALAQVKAECNLKQAREFFRRARSLEPKNVITLNSWVDVEAEAGNLQKAERLLNLSSKLDPENAYTLSALARLFEKKGDRQQALKYRKQASAWFTEID